jgi:nitroreductase
MKTGIHTEVGIMEAIFNRRSVRRYDAREVDAETVQTLLQAAVQAPSAMNQQPWLFGVFHGRQRLLDYSERAKRYLLAHHPTAFELHPRSALYDNPDFDIFHGASTLIVIFAERGQWHATEDCCLAAQNLMLAAYGLGLGTCPIGFARPWLDQPETKRELDVPEHCAAVFPLVLGFPASQPAPTPRAEPGIVSWHWDPP